MARYFFELTRGNLTVPDEQGSVCKDDDTAIAYAWQLLGDCMRNPMQILPWQQAEISIKREDNHYVGLVVMTVEVNRQNPATAAELSEIKRL